jgi:hypothetical protein
VTAVAMPRSVIDGFVTAALTSWPANRDDQLMTEL